MHMQPAHHPPTRQPDRDFLLDAMRRWRRVKDGGGATQPALYGHFVVQEREMLTPVVDGLMTLFEAALGRPVAIGSLSELTLDEDLLLSMLHVADAREPGFSCSGELRLAFGHALTSARVMMALNDSTATDTRQAQG